VNGYIKDYRKEIESDIWMMPPLYHRVWQYLKYMVNHEDAEIPMKDGTKFKIEIGQHLTSLRGISKGISWYEGRVLKEPNPKTIKVILNWLEKVRMIDVSSGRGNREYTLVTLLNWDIYQSKEERGNSKVTAEKQRADINKNDKNDKEKDICIYRQFKHLSLTEEEFNRLLDDGYSKELIDNTLDSIENYSKNKNYTSLNLTVRKWIKKEGNHGYSNVKSFRPRETTDREHLENDAQKAKGTQNGKSNSAGFTGNAEHDLDQFVRR
jgi:hypothetical protein